MVRKILIFFPVDLFPKAWNNKGYFFWQLKEKRIEKKIAPLSKFISNFKPCKIDFNRREKVISNAGAEHWYGIGVYNGD